MDWNEDDRLLASVIAEDVVQKFVGLEHPDYDYLCRMVYAGIRRMLFHERFHQPAIEGNRLTEFAEAYASTLKMLKDALK